MVTAVMAVVVVLAAVAAAMVVCMGRSCHFPSDVNQ